MASTTNPKRAARDAVSAAAADSAPNTVAQHALEQLRSLIVARELRPGQRVGQEEIAERVGVSLAPVREALASLEQEGQLIYKPRRGYFVTELRLDDLREIYELRAVLEERAARLALPLIEEEDIERMRLAARGCADSAEMGDVAAELRANRQFHFAIFGSPDPAHTLRLIRQLWDSTEPYRALYYSSPVGRTESLQAHDRILEAVRAGEADRLIDELGRHRTEALERLAAVLSPPDSSV